MRCVVLILMVMITALNGVAQFYTGLNGLINTPSAEMMPAGEAQIGGCFLNSHFLPDAPGKSGFKYDGERYNSADFFLSLTPFRWVEISYTFTLLKTLTEGHDKPGYNQKDRYISLKFNPLREGRWWPAVAIGANDFLSSATKRHAGASEDSGYFNNYFIVLTKHFRPSAQEIGLNLAYRYSSNDYQKKWTGVVGGLTWRPRWVPNLRMIAEWTGNEVNIGADALLFKHLYLQASLVRCKYFNGGLSYRVNLF